MYNLYLQMPLRKQSTYHTVKIIFPPHITTAVKQWTSISESKAMKNKSFTQIIAN